MKKPFNVSSGLLPLSGDKATTAIIASSVDVLTIIAIIGRFDDFYYIAYVSQE
jgi:choline-glycine betaine transporter